MVSAAHHAQHGQARNRTWRNFPVFVLLACAVFPPGCSSQSVPAPPQDHNKQLQHEIRRLEAEWRTAMLSNDVPTLDRLLDNEYIGISSTGMLQTKPQFLAAHNSGHAHFDRLDYSDVKVRVYGDTAVVTAQVSVLGRNENDDITGRHRYTRVYHRSGGAWKIISFENSQISDGHR